MTDHLHRDQTHQGTVRDIFGHRFVLDTTDGPVLADVGPHAPEGVLLKQGAKVKITGEKTPCEVKVRLFQTGSASAIAIPHGKPKKHEHEHPADPSVAVKAARDAGFAVKGEPRRKPKHFEVDATREGHHYELHITLDGTIRKEKPGHS